MDNLKLRIPTDALSQSRSGSIFGNVFIQYGSETFPGPRWSDLAVAFASVWIAALVRLHSSTARSERVRFMDGPYWVDFTKSIADRNSISIEFVWDQLKGPITKQSTVATLGELLSDAVQVGREVLMACRSSGWNNSDVIELDESLIAAAHLSKTRFNKRGLA
jgi:hypothetical protein